MGESTNPRGKLRFDRRIRLEFHGATITSDAGLLARRELDDALGLTETANECLQESRGGRNRAERTIGGLGGWSGTPGPTSGAPGGARGAKPRPVVSRHWGRLRKPLYGALMPSFLRAGARMQPDRVKGLPSPVHVAGLVE